MYAEIIIPLALPKTYTWFIPEKFQSQIKHGSRAEVSLKNKKYAGIIKAIHHAKPAGFEPKEILSLLDNEPIIHPHQLQLWTWIANYYLCTEGEVMAAALPAHLKLSSESTLLFNDEFGDDFSTLNHDEYLIAEALLLKKELLISEVQQILDSAHVYPVIKKLLDKKVCFVRESLKETYSAKTEIFISLNPRYNDDESLSLLLAEDKKLQRAEKQMELLLAYLHLLRTQGIVTKTELLRKSKATDAQLRGLVEKNILDAEKRNIDRINYLPQKIEIDFSLTEPQAKAFDEVQNSFKLSNVCLLHGVTSSGKTLIYIKLIEQYVKLGKQILYLLPEIALTSQIIRRLQKHFGGFIGIYHSKFSHNERIEIWNKIKSSELKIVLGVRSALFLPFENLGLIIVDEEHDASYKQQEPAPRYHARDAAVYYAGLFEAKILLGSATPSVESYYNATHNKYALVELNERYGNIELPEIEIADTKKIIDQEKNKVIITPQLKESIELALKNNKQVILFQNRRGYSPYQVCKVCGWIPQCKNCDVSLTYHKYTNKLQCHYCGTIYPPVETCTACGNHQFVKRNFGTEKIEEHLEETFPNAKIARMDVDSIRGKTAHDSLIKLFEQKKIDLLVGTQMVVKGLDFDNVELVGIVDADSILNFTDFRVNERGFQLMEQVSGRAGRKDKQGKVLIQAANTNHPILAFVQKHDYKLFYENEIIGRKLFFYPPYSRIIMITFKHKIKEIAETAAAVFANNIKNHFSNYMSGPSEPPVNRIRNQYIMELLLKLPKDTKTITLAKKVIQQQTIILHGDKKFRGVVIIPDVDSI